MENDLDRTIYVEFYGLPGCGKSTVSHMIARDLKMHGYIVREPSYDFDHKLRPIYRRIKKLLYTIWFRLLYPDDYKNAKKNVIMNGYISFKLYMGQLVNILPKLLVYKKNRNGIVIWDEGLIQSSISLAFQSGKDVNSIISSFNFKRNNSILIKIDVSEKLAMERMNNRETNDSRIEKEMNPIKQHAMMKKYQKAVENIKSDILICGNNIIEDHREYESVIEQICFRI